MQTWLRLTRFSIRILAGLLLGLLLLGANGYPGDVASSIVWVGGGLLALLGQGWALQRAIDRKLAERIQLHREGCHPATAEGLGEVKETLARMETKLSYIEKELQRLNQR